MRAQGRRAKSQPASIRPIFRYRHIFPRCVETASTNAPIQDVISDEYTLDDIQKAFEDSITRKNEVIKAVIRVD